jgi:hypothetical protein
MAETELHRVPGWSAENVARLGNSWISSAEQVVAIGVTSGGVQSLAEQMGISEQETQRLISLARAALTPETRSEMGQRFDSNERGMGALHPGKEGKTSGNE